MEEWQSILAMRDEQIACLNEDVAAMSLEDPDLDAPCPICTQYARFGHL